MPSFPFDLAVWVMLVMAAVAAVSDLRTGLISNVTVVLGALGGALAQLASLDSLTAASLGTTALRIALGALLCAVVPLTLYLLGGLGGGDLKLFVAIGICLGPLDGLSVQLSAFALMTLLLPVYLARTGKLRVTLRTSGRLLRNMLRRADSHQVIESNEVTSLRFAPAIFAAALWVACTESLP